MSRLFIFLLGVLAGGAGVFYLVDAGIVEHPRAPAPASAEVATPDPVASNPLQLPGLPASPSVSPPALPVGDLALPAGAELQARVAAPPLPASVQAEGLLIPVTGVNAAQLSDTYTQSRGEARLHDAIDIMAPRGTPVVAVADGRVVKLFNSKQGGLTVYQFDREEKLAYYYAHLDSYAPGLAEGSVLKRGEPVGLVGSTGNANAAAPHLHFAVFVLGPEKSWWKGTAINPYPLLGGRALRPIVPADAPDATAR